MSKIFKDYLEKIYFSENFDSVSIETRDNGSFDSIRNPECIWYNGKPAGTLDLIDAGLVEISVNDEGKLTKLEILEC